jgi:putative zinc finger protein
LDEIEAGTDCERLSGLLPAMADGEASGEELALLRPHLRTCLACRTRLREYRAAPARVAALVPPVALGAARHGGGPRSLIESVLGTAQHKAAALGERAHAAAELATGQKAVPRCRCARPLADPEDDACLVCGREVGCSPSSAASGDAPPTPVVLEFRCLRHEWALLPLRVRGIERVRLHADLTILAKRACALARARAEPLAA